MSSDDVREALGCLLWVVAVFLIIFLLNVGDDIIAWAERSIG